MPTLMNNTNGEEYRSKLKKAISGVNQALTLHYALEGLTVRDYSSAENLVQNVFKKRMNVIDIDDGTFPEEYKILYKEGDNRYYCTPDSQNSFITQDGVIFCVPYLSLRGNDCDSFNENPCSTNGKFPNLFIDVNGFKKPNKPTNNSSHPRDQYHALIYNTRVLPYPGATACVMSDTSNCINYALPVPQ